MDALTLPAHSLLDPVMHAQNLIRCRSITPLEGGALDYLERVLAGAGFSCHRLRFSDSGTPDVENLYARIGQASPHLCLAGHADVVPPGDEAAWRHPPFAAVIENGVLYGRGAADMKGGVAALLAAALRYLAAANGKPKGSISFLLTCDEEGPAINGARKVLDWMERRGEQPDHCLLGEPTNATALGEEIKIGRRGSLNGALVVIGTQGHVAYPHLANNPVNGLISVLREFLAEPLDHGSAHFAPSNLEITSIDTGNPVTNLIPARVRARLNIRFNDRQSPEKLAEWLHGKARQALHGSGLAYELTFEPAADCFLTEPGPWVSLLAKAITKETGRTPVFGASGGTSDARFIKNICPVVEFGLKNESIHKVDEHVAVEDLVKLTAIYETFITSYFAAGTAW